MTFLVESIAHILRKHLFSLGSGSGKTTIADAIVKYIGRERIAFLHHDNYYRDLSHLPIEERAKNNFDHPNSLETELLVEVR